MDSLILTIKCSDGEILDVDPSIIKHSELLSKYAETSKNTPYWEDNEDENFDEINEALKSILDQEELKIDQS